MSIEQIPIERFVGWAVVVDLTDKGHKEPISAKDLEERGSAIQPGDIAILRNDWTQKHWDTKTFYAGENPYLTYDACQWLVDHEVKCVITDFDVEDVHVDVKPGPNHVLLLGHGIPLVEYPIHLDQLTKDRVFVFAAPIKIRGCDGAPCRIVAVEEV
jgi:arylformamidase